MQFNNVFGHNIICFRGKMEESRKVCVKELLCILCDYVPIVDVAQVFPQRGNADDWDSVVSLKQQPYWSLVRRVLELLIVFLLLKLFAWSVIS